MSEDKNTRLIDYPYKLMSWSFSNIPAFGRLFSDESYLKIKYRSAFGKKLNLDNPITFSEKLQWLKLYDRKPEYSVMVDKYEVKKYVADIIGEEYIIPTLGVWDRFDDIDFASLPNQFVLKCTHDSGGLVICKDIKSFNIEEARRKIESSLQNNFYWISREWPYKNVRPRIIAEEYLEEETGKNLCDYKVFNFAGEPKLIQVDFNRFIEHKRTLYNTRWEKLPVKYVYESDSDLEKNQLKPKNLDRMLTLAKKLSSNTAFLRTDFYLLGDRIYFGELTFFPEGGIGLFTPKEWDRYIGDWINLPIHQ